jgi:hypothetical protein
MKSVFFCLSLAVWPALGGELNVPPAPVALYTEFQEQPPGAVLEALENEVADILAPAGMHLEWRSLAKVRGDEVSAELAVVKFKGRCDATALSLHNPEPGALGWTHISDGVILPFSDVDCGRIREFLRNGLMRLPARVRQQALGRAVGRVLAHELYHIFTKTTHHSAAGVAKSAYSVGDLLSEDFKLQELDSQALRASQEHAVPDSVVITR